MIRIFAASISTISMISTFIFCSIGMICAPSGHSIDMINTFVVRTAGTVMLRIFRPSRIRIDIKRKSCTSCIIAIFRAHLINIIIPVRFQRSGIVLRILLRCVLHPRSGFLVARFFLLGHILINIQRIHRIPQLLCRISYIACGISCLVNKTAVFACLIHDIIHAAHQVIGGTDHAVRPLYRPVSQHSGVVQRFIHKILYHRQSGRNGVRLRSRILQHPARQIMQLVDIFRQLIRDIFRKIHRNVRLGLTRDTAYIFPAVYVSRIFTGIDIA